MSQSGIDFRDEKKVIYQEREKKKSCIKMSKLNPHADIKLQRKNSLDISGMLVGHTTAICQ